jgi:hypothetical protein
MRTQRMLFILATSLAVIAVGFSDFANAHSDGGGGGDRHGWVGPRNYSVN